MERIPAGAATATIPSGHAGNLLLRLRQLADCDGVVRESCPSLASLTGYSVRSIWRYISSLQDAGFLALVDSGRGSHGGSIYRLSHVPDHVPDHVPNGRPHVPTRAPHLSNNLSTKDLKPQVVKAFPNGELIPNKASIVSPDHVPPNVPLGPVGQRLVGTVAAAMANGRKSWDLTHDVQRIWDVVATDRAQGVSPQQVLGELIRVVYEQDLTKKDWARAGNLCRLYGKSALYGTVEAIKHDIPLENGGLWNYAITVAAERQKTFRAQRGEG